MVCIRYRPRQPRSSSVWQILHDQAGQLPVLRLHPEASAAIAAVLRCGDLHAGFHPAALPRLRPRIPPRLHLQTARPLPGGDFEQTGFEPPHAPEAPAAATGQGQLFSDDSAQPDAADGEPVFWCSGVTPFEPADDYIQADAPESS